MNVAAPHVTLIASVDRNGGIGRGNELLWRESEDLKRFRHLTTGHPIIMGRKTWDSIGRPLPGRRNIVVTRNTEWQNDGAERAASLEEAIALCAGVSRVFVIGGAQIFAEAMPHADRLELTEIDAVFDADAYFPDWDRDSFMAVAIEQKQSASGQTYRFASYQLQRGD